MRQSSPPPVLLVGGPYDGRRVGLAGVTINWLEVRTMGEGGAVWPIGRYVPAGHGSMRYEPAQPQTRHQ